MVEARVTTGAHQTTQLSGKRIPSLDGLRALSILLVFLGHLAGTRHFFSSDQMRHFGDLGNLGVRTFFVISGFLITRLLLLELEKTSGISLKMFYIRRALRIFPAFYVFVGVAAVLTLFGILANDARDFLHALTYTMNYEAVSDHFSLRHLWSLSVEEQFYLMWPLTLAVLGVARGSVLLVAVIACVPVLRIALYHLVPGYEGYMMMAFESVCDALAMGALLAIAYPTLRQQAWFQRLVASPAFPAVFLVLFAANLQTDHPHMFWLVCIPVMNVAIALIVARYVEYPMLPLGRALNARALVAIGTISYSLYLWQELFLVQWRPTTSMLQQFPLNVVAACVCGVLSYRLVEQPFLRLKRHFEASPAAGAEATLGDASAGDLPSVGVLAPGSPSPA